jgi:hypothetical protein
MTLVALAFVAGLFLATAATRLYFSSILRSMRVDYLDSIRIQVQEAHHHGYIRGMNDEKDRKREMQQNRNNLMPTH